MLTQERHLVKRDGQGKFKAERNRKARPGACAPRERAFVPLSSPRAGGV